MPVSDVLNTEPFINYKDTIELLYSVDDDFKTLCDEYCNSLANIQKWKNKLIEYKQREIDYKHLLLDLETELFHWY
jgi:hypothetical protein